jgi:RNA polymerase sigma-B factor
VTPRTEAELAARSIRRSDNRVSVRRRHSERELVVLYQNDPSTRETVIEAFRPLAHSVAKRYHRGEEPLEDLEQVALLGLVKALERFDPDRGSPFATYAMPTMTGEVRRHYRDTGWAVHVSRGAQEMAQKIAAVERASTEKLTVEQVAKRIGCEVEDVVNGRLAQRAMRADSLDRPRRDEEGDVAEPAIAPAANDPGYAAAEHRATIARLTEGLPEREREILALRFAGDLSQAEIGRQVGISQMHVSRILRRTLAELQEADAAVIR